MKNISCRLSIQFSTSALQSAFDACMSVPLEPTGKTSILKLELSKSFAVNFIHASAISNGTVSSP